jgi:hypothetical protein
MKNGVFWDITPCAFYKNRRTHRASVVSYGYVPSSPILVTLMMEALGSSETSVLIKATRRNISEDDFFADKFGYKYTVYVLESNEVPQ